MSESAVAGTVERLGIPVGRISGVPVFLKPSWFVVAAVVTVLYAPTVRRGAPELGGSTVYAVGFSFAVLLLLSVLVHEVAHAAAARATGTPASHIVLDVWGGHTAFASDSAGPWRSILVAAVGPASNAALGIAAWAADAVLAPGGVPGALLASTAWANAVVAGFNALPGLPLDGGRVLEGLVWRVTGDHGRGTIAAGWCGRLVAGGLVVAVLAAVVGGEGLGISGLWLLLIAGLLWQGAGQAIASARWRRQADRASAVRLLRPAVAVASTTTLGAAMAATDRGEPGAAVVVLDVYGRPAAILDEEAAGSVPDHRIDSVPAMSVAETLTGGAVIEARLIGDELLARLRETPAPRYVVTSADGAVVGVLEWDDVARFVAGR